ncbi:DUF669 domain-containing protein [Pseudomonas sp.]|uniref:DUF669 domain-containing protein n=1 Tax=Pseudomonas sp. TaxID=306 RepID=UPI00258AF004|nr:DUF669 domain-containing protein [Pseudomonas sp.]
MFFDATNIDTSSQFDAIPAGDYEAMVTGSAMKSTRDGTGQYLELTVEIQSGQFQGRRLWDRLNLQNRNPKAVEIAQKQLAQLCHAINVLQVQSPEQLHNRPFIVKVTAKNDPERGMTNEIKGYKARAAMQQQAPAFQAPRAAAPVAAPAAAPAGMAQGGPLPWATA